MNHILVTLAGAAIGASAWAQPHIDSLGRTEIPRSGRLVILGSGFGDGTGASRVEIDGTDALHATWTDGRIVAYVPESADLGGAVVRVRTDEGLSNDEQVIVHPRQSEGRVRWTFETDSSTIFFRPALAPDGSIYAHDSLGYVYALAPDGGLRWITKVAAFPSVPPTVGPDGTIYVGTLDTFFAIDPGGEILWSFEDSSSQAAQVALTPGSDGSLYGAFDLGLGAVSLTAAGQFRWNNEGSPLMFEFGGLGAEMRFGPSAIGGGPDQLYIGMDRTNDPHIYAIDLAGQQRWAVPVGGNVNGAVPVIGTDGVVYSEDFRPNLGWVIVGIDPEDGSELWLYDGDFISTMSRMDIAPDNTLYYVRDGGFLEALGTEGPTLAWSTFTGDILSQPEVSPDGSIVLLGGTSAFGMPGFIRAFGTSDGTPLWSIDLPGDAFPGTRWLVSENPRMTDDSATAYFSTITLGDDGGDPHAFVYAIRIVEDSCPADLDGDGDTDSGDFFAYLDAFVNDELDICDRDNDGDCDADDFFTYLDSFAAGC